MKMALWRHVSRSKLQNKAKKTTLDRISRQNYDFYAIKIQQFNVAEWFVSVLWITLRFNTILSQ